MVIDAEDAALVTQLAKHIAEERVTKFRAARVIRAIKLLIKEARVDDRRQRILQTAGEDMDREDGPLLFGNSPRKPKLRLV